MSTREQLAGAVIALGDEARRAADDSVWMRSHRHGDPTAIDVLAMRALPKLGLDPATTLREIRDDPKLAALLRETVARALDHAEQERGGGRRMALAFGVGVPVAIVICVGAWFAYHLYEDNPEVQRRNAQRAAQPQPPSAPAPAAR